MWFIVAGRCKVGSLTGLAAADTLVSSIFLTSVNPKRFYTELQWYNAAVVWKQAKEFDTKVKSCGVSLCLRVIHSTSTTFTGSMPEVMILTGTLLKS